MTDEQINEKIAFELGWRQLQDGRWKLNDRVECEVPNYCNDLNAMHEAEKVLTGVQCVQYGYRLRAQYGPGDEVASFWGWHHGATQRAKAFLRTLNLWEK